MAVFKCKMCGGSLEVTEGTTVCECEYCGTKQTLPKSGDDATSRLFNRANHLRMKCEFDKAQEIYEKIVSTQTDDAEAYWGLVLCKFGIEYVEDPGTFRKIPTCHRTQLDSVLADMDYQSALKYADPEQKVLYETEAKEIDRLQKNILDIVRKEKPFDVFICYKETDDSGKRTQDSVIANDIYYQLTQEGFKVFYAAITLEDKLGQEYEPYIFAALSSAKVMLVIGTKSEYFEAVWVKNEWSRFLKLMKQDRKKQLIPCYRDMDAYDMPEEFSHLQAQDMSKIGFINDLVRGIRKLTQDSAEKPVVQKTIVTGNANTEPLLKRVSLFLEDGDWNSAKEYCEKVLDIDPECAQAYIDLLLVKLRKHTMTELENSAIMEGIAEDDDFKKAVRFADEKTKNWLTQVDKQIIYNFAENLLNAAKTDLDYDKAKQVYESICGYKDSAEKIKACEQRALEYLYQIAEEKYHNAKTDADYRAAKEVYEPISGYKDSAEKITACEQRALEYLYQIAEEKYHNAKTDEDYRAAKEAYEPISGYKDTAEKIQACEQNALEYLYQIAEKRFHDAQNAIEYLDVAKEYEKIKGYKDAEEKIQACYEQVYQIAEKKLNDAATYSECMDAEEIYIKISGYKDADKKTIECREKAEIILRRINIKEQKKKKIIIIVIISIILGIALGIISFNIYKVEKIKNTFRSAEEGDIVSFGKDDVGNDYRWYVINETSNDYSFFIRCF